MQAAGKVAIDVERIGCDLLTVAAHKMHGPQGVGALFVRRERGCVRCRWADATSADAARVRKTWRALWALARPAEMAKVEWFSEGGDVLMADLRDRLEQGVCCAVKGVAGERRRSRARVPTHPICCLRASRARAL